MQRNNAGRDAELFGPVADSSVVLQYSVTQHWQSKIRETAARISETLPKASVLIYITNQRIGAGADSLKGDLRKEFNIHLDIRDRNYFLERLVGDPRREAIGEALAREVVDLFLASRGVVERRATELSSIEARAAFVYLGLHWRDDIRAKGLTKLSFEALVSSALRDTSSENRMSRDEIKKNVQAVLPNHPPDKLDIYTDSALRRLTKRTIRHWAKEDEFCLTHEENVRLRAFLAEQELAEKSLEEEIENILTAICAAKRIDRAQCGDLQQRVRRVLEAFLFRRGEAFVSAVSTGRLRQLAFDDLTNLIIENVRGVPPPRGVAAAIPDLLSASVREVLTRPTNEIHRYLRSLADSYTLLAFLEQTPDVQSAVGKMFSHGEVWLDTNVVLPIFGEVLSPEHERRFQLMVGAASEAGLSLRATPGVIEEIERQMNRSLACSRSAPGEWQGDLPYLASVYLGAFAKHICILA